MIDEMLKRHRLISDQVDEKELRVILRELLIVLESGIVGDIVEFGCYKGTTSLFLARVLEKFNSDKKLFLYDSFAGLPEKTVQDNSRVGDDFKAGELLATKADLIKNFRKENLPMPVIRKAWFGDLTDRDVPPQICFAFFDGDFYESIRDSFRVCERYFSPGATIVVDDYQNEALPGASKATDEWLYKNSARVKNFRIEQSLGIIHLR